VCYNRYSYGFRAVHVVSSGKVRTESLMITIHDRHGTPLDARCSVVGTPTGCRITFECRGGTKGTSNARNLEYMDGLDAVLGRLASLKAVLVDAFLDTKITNRLGLSHEDRRLNMPGFAFPVILSPGVDLIRLRNELCAAQRPIGRTADAKGAGNNTKRFAIVCDWGVGGAPLDLSAIGDGSGDLDNQDESPRMHPPAGQGRGLSTPEKHAVERHAMQMATAFFSREWPIVIDISRTQPCDLLCKRGTDQLWVEVKGTTGGVGKVLVTGNEVVFAREHHPSTALCVIHGITLTLSAAPEHPNATGGVISVERPWNPADERLTATQFEYEVSLSDVHVRSV
jgi:hypothetical protein